MVWWLVGRKQGWFVAQEPLFRQNPSFSISTFTFCYLIFNLFTLSGLVGGWKEGRLDCCRRASGFSLQSAGAPLLGETLTQFLNLRTSQVKLMALFCSSPNLINFFVLLLHITKKKIAPSSPSSNPPPLSFQPVGVILRVVNVTSITWVNSSRTWLCPQIRN